MKTAMPPKLHVIISSTRPSRLGPSVGICSTRSEDGLAL
jgi:hypothetical protein